MPEIKQREIKIYKRIDLIKKDSSIIEPSPIVFDEKELIELRRWHLWSLDLINAKLGNTAHEGREAA